MRDVWLGANVCLIELPAELIDPDEGPLFSASAPQSTVKNSRLILDFSALQMMNGLGATMLVKLSALAKRRQQRILAVGVSNHYRDVLQVTGLDRAILICSSREEAFEISGISGKDMPAQKTTPSKARDISSWAKPVAKLSVPAMPPEAINMNMKGFSSFPRE